MFGFAKKIGMTRLFINNKSVAVSVLEIPENIALQKKTLESDGYKALQVGTRPKTKGVKASQGHLKKYGAKEPDFAHIAEFKYTEELEPEVFTGQNIQVDDLLKVTGKTKGRGFTGVVKRYGFRGQPKSHGHDHERAVGSIGDMGAQRVFPGTKMAGRSGNENRTLNKVKVVAVDPEQNLVFVKGSLPGPNSGYLKIQKINL